MNGGETEQVEEEDENDDEDEKEAKVERTASLFQKCLPSGVRGP